MTIFNLPKLLKQKIKIEGQNVNGYILTRDKTHCLYLSPTGRLYEFEETGLKDVLFTFVRLK